MSQVVLTGGLTGESRLYIGIDTSNYTTSAAVFDASTGTFLSNVKRLLGVAEGERGLRQSDAVFAHVRNLPSVTAEAFESLEPANLCAVERRCRTSRKRFSRLPRLGRNYRAAARKAR